MNWIDDEVLKREEAGSRDREFASRVSVNDAKMRELWGVIRRKIETLPEQIRPEHKDHGTYEVLRGKGTIYLDRTVHASIGGNHRMMIMDQTDHVDGHSSWQLGILYDDNSNNYKIESKELFKAPTISEVLTEAHIDRLIRTLCTTWRLKEGIFGEIPTNNQTPQTPKANSGTSCFIATAVYGADSAQVYVLRNFRDEILTKSIFGRFFISVYIHISPPIAKCLTRCPKASTLVRSILVNPALWCVERLRKA